VATFRQDGWLATVVSILLTPLTITRAVAAAMPPAGPVFSFIYDYVTAADGFDVGPGLSHRALTAAVHVGAVCSAAALSPLLSIL